MDRTLTRKLSLSDEEVAEAVKYWLVNKHDVQIGENPTVYFITSQECEITSHEDAQIELGDKDFDLVNAR